jgi:hypothetical protein
MTTDTKKLRDLAQAATRGPWRNGADPSHFDAPEVTDGKTFAYWVTKDADAAFIAAANPQTVIALLDHIEDLTKAVEAAAVKGVAAGKLIAQQEASAEIEKLRKNDDEVSRQRLEDHGEYKRRRNEQFAAYEALEARLAGAEAANAATTASLVEHAELGGHIDIAEQCRDYVAHEAMDHGDPSGKLRDFTESLRIVIDQLELQRRSRNWYEAAYEAGKQKLVERAVSKALDVVRAAARAYAHHVNQLGLAADDNDPKVMATAGPIGAAQADLWIALGIYEEAKPCGFGVDGKDCYACELSKAGAK